MPHRLVQNQPHAGLVHLLHPEGTPRLPSQPVQVPILAAQLLMNLIGFVTHPTAFGRAG